MTSDSVILIDEMIMPDTSTHWRAAQLDLLMMALLAAQERTKKQWDYVLEAAGLEIQEVYTYTDELQDSIIVAVPRGS
jgi:demethylsterigmatocystin 6-O-methyltransferase